MLIKNVFGKTTPVKPVKNHPMVLTKNDGTTVVIPVSAMKKDGFLKESVSKRILSDKLEDALWLHNHYEIEFIHDGDNNRKVGK